MSGIEPFLMAMGASAGTAATVSTVAGVAGTVMSVAGALQSGKADRNAANYNAEAARQDAASKEAAQRVQAQRQMGSIRASIGKSGATSAGTPLMVLAESASNAEIDALNTRRTGIVESDIYTARGKNAYSASKLRAGTSLLSGMSRIF